MKIEVIKHKILQLDKDKKIKFIILFGSHDKNERTPLSDIDIAVFYDGPSKKRFSFRIKASGNLPKKVDVQIFQDLPLYIQKEVLKGKVLYSQDFQFTFDQFMKVIREFGSFEKYYREYIFNLQEEAGIA